MPEMPELPPFVPIVPTFPDLPAEIPWPPDFDFEYDLSPWYSGNDGRPYCYNDFASRLMRLIIAVSAFRAAAGLRPMYPPFDLRFMVATPTIVNIAALWLATMWNTATVAGGTFDKTFALLGTTNPNHDATLKLDGTTYTFYNYYTRVTELRQTFGVTYGSAGVFFGAGYIFENVDIARGATLSAATLTTTAFAASSSRKIKASVFGYDGGYSPAGAGFADTASFLGLHNNPTTAKVLWDIASTTAGATYNPPSVATVVQEILLSSTWDSGDSMALFVSDLTDKRGSSYDHSQLYTWATEQTGVFPRPYLNIVGTSAGVSAPPIYPLSLSSLNCGQMNGWLATVEGIVWPILRA